jgi:hypothetical protein
MSNSSSVDGPILAAKICTCFGLVVVGTILALHITSFFRFGFSSDKFHVRKTLMAATCMVFVTAATVGSYWFFDWRSNEYGCYLVGSFATLMYIISKQFQLIFLFERAKVVHISLRLNSFRIKALRWLVFLGATIGVAVAFYWACFVLHHGAVEPTRGVGMIYSDSPVRWISI